ncbi:hypothetical protein PVK06_020089 [Gossypium arboreum]|uniref:RNase H type-1 domain-containing protein n=1 Tax=Gossypium arboreum TaxID=29729 RepID=A0ABR0PLG8_GOSAR|nr:hypothetical protein PVK06_020089 [Gossypium arboreum]
MWQILQGLCVAFSTTNGEKNWKFWLAKEFVNNIQSMCKKTTIIYRALWHNRIKIYHEGVRKSMHELLAFINTYILETKKLEDIAIPMQNPKVSKWEPPNGENVKANFDASFYQQSNRSISRILIRNKEGLVIATFTHSNKHMIGSTMEKVQACLQSLTFAEELSFRKILVEGDALTIIRKIEEVPTRVEEITDQDRVNYKERADG